jgi:hypothetical protein
MDTDSPLLERTLVEPERGAMAELYTRYVPAGIRLAYLLTDGRCGLDLVRAAEDLRHARLLEDRS